MQAELPKDILAFISQAFQEAAHPSQFKKIIEQPIQLFVVQKEDRNLCYLTDGTYTILALAAGKKDTFHVPNNTIPTRYYIYQEKTYLYLNFTHEHPKPQPQKMHPYTPHFYFRDNYDKFLQVRPSLALSNPCQVLHLTKWQLELVNINSVGYYAPAIIIHEFKRSLSSRPPAYMSLNCILFEPLVQRMMEEYRLMDLREYFATKLPRFVSTSLFYLARRLTLNTGKVQNNSIVTIDRFNKEILAYRGDNPSMVICSDYLEGICSIASPVKQEINQEQMEKIQFRHLNQLFNGLNLSQEKQLFLENKKKEVTILKKEKEQMRRQKNQLWSDSSSEGSDSDSEREESKTAEALLVPENDSEEDEEDPLRALYKRQLSRRK